jgi:hypothetical protein
LSASPYGKHFQPFDLPLADVDEALKGRSLRAAAAQADDDSIAHDQQLPGVPDLVTVAVLGHDGERPEGLGLLALA